MSCLGEKPPGTRELLLPPEICPKKGCPLETWNKFDGNPPPTHPEATKKGAAKKKLPPKSPHLQPQPAKYNNTGFPPKTLHSPYHRPLPHHRILPPDVPFRASQHLVGFVHLLPISAHPKGTVTPWQKGRGIGICGIIRQVLPAASLEAHHCAPGLLEKMIARKDGKIWRCFFWLSFSSRLFWSLDLLIRKTSWQILECCVFLSKELGWRGQDFFTFSHVAAVNSARQATTFKSLVDVFPWKNPWELEDTWSLFPVTFANFFLLCLELSFAPLPWKKTSSGSIWLTLSRLMTFGWGPNAALVTQPWRSSQLPLSITEFGLNGTPQNFQWMIRDALEDFDFFGWHSHKKMAQTAVSSNTWAVGSCLKKLFEPFQLHQNQRFMQKEFFGTVDDEIFVPSCRGGVLGDVFTAQIHWEAQNGSVLPT